MNAPTLNDIRDTRERLNDLVVKTPVWQWRTREITEIVGDDTEVFLKLELFQYTGTFKPRGALTNMLDLDSAALSRGVTAVSAGNHAIAVSYAAKLLNSSAKVVMPKTANPARVTKCRAYGATVELVDNVHEAFARVKQIEEEEGRYFVHPFEGNAVTRGTATVGLEFCQQVENLDAVIIPIGGGGLCSGISLAVKLLQPQCQVFGVEPEGADSMHRSFAQGSPAAIDKVGTIADSLGAPHAAPYSFAICQQNVDELVKISDTQIRQGMALLFNGAKLAVEPAGAATTAALCGPLRERLRGKRVGLIICGANIDIATFSEQATIEPDKF
ncbi:MAG: threonine/serine dehydratase [Chloroflexota bacterium]